jgi:phage recombination protein Bet
MTRSALAKTAPTVPVYTEWNEEQIALIKSQIAVGCTDAELDLFGMVCQKTGLDPFSKQIYAIRRKVWDSEKNATVTRMTIQTSIDGFRLIAARSGVYGGSITYWCGKDGIWLDVWLSDELPAASKTEVWRIGSDRPFVSVVRFDDYKQVNDKGKLIAQWYKMPTGMIGKCGEAAALRRGFPAELSGIYATEEMGQAENDTPADIQDKIKQRQQGLAECMEILGWTDQNKKREWSNTINKLPYSKWTLADWDLAVVQAQAAIDRAVVQRDQQSSSPALDVQVM